MYNKKVGFIGAGYMGYGMSKNLIKDFDLYVIAHKNRKPIDKLIEEGATEVFTYKELLNLNLDCLMMCVTCLLYTSPSPRDQRGSRMPSSA